MMRSWLLLSFLLALTGCNCSTVTLETADGGGKPHLDGGGGGDGGFIEGGGGR